MPRASQTTATAEAEAAQLAADLAAIDDALAAKLKNAGLNPDGDFLSADDPQYLAPRSSRLAEIKREHEAARETVLSRYGVARRRIPDMEPFDADVPPDEILAVIRTVLERDYRAVAALTAIRGELQIGQAATVDAARSHVIAAVRRLRADGRAGLPMLPSLDTAAGVEQAIGAVLDNLRGEGGGEWRRMRKHEARLKLGRKDLRTLKRDGVVRDEPNARPQSQHCLVLVAALNEPERSA